MKRLLDIILSILGITLMFIPILLISFCIKITSKGPIIHWSKRFGKNKKLFLMPKFRTMILDAPQVETELMKNSDIYLTTVGKYLRKYSLDEIPQLFSVLYNHMSIVGPRPALFTQIDLIEMREEKGINSILPGITGLSQVMGRDSHTNLEKVGFDNEYLLNKSFSFDIFIIIKTIINVILSKNINH